MKSRLVSLAVLGAFTVAASTVTAAPVKLSKAQLDQVVAGIGDNWTTKKENGGGNTPNGSANGVPTTVENPGGKTPPGQN